MVGAEENHFQVELLAMVAASGIMLSASSDPSSGPIIDLNALHRCLRLFLGAHEDHGSALPPGLSRRHCPTGSGSFRDLAVGRHGDQRIPSRRPCHDCFFGAGLFPPCRSRCPRGNSWRYRANKWCCTHGVFDHGIEMTRLIGRDMGRHIGDVEDGEQLNGNLNLPAK